MELENITEFLESMVEHAAFQDNLILDEVSFTGSDDYQSYVEGRCSGITGDGKEFKDCHFCLGFNGRFVVHGINDSGILAFMDDAEADLDRLITWERMD